MSLVSNQFVELVNQIKSGRITAERLQAFLDHPDGRLIDDDVASRELVGVLPDGCWRDHSVKYVDGKLLYVDHNRLVYGDDVRGPFERIGSYQVVNGKLGYACQRWYAEHLRNVWFVVHGNEKYGPYDGVESAVQIVRDMPLFVARTAAGLQYLEWGDTFHSGIHHERISHARLLEGIPLYVAYDKRRARVMHGSVETGSYETIWEPGFSEGHLFFAAKKDGRSCVVIDGEERDSCEEVTNVQWLDGKLSYVRKESGTVELIIGRQSHPLWRGIGGWPFQTSYYPDPQWVDGRPLHISCGGFGMIVNFGKWISRAYADIETPRVVDGEVTFVARSKARRCVVVGHQEFGGYFDQVLSTDITDGFLTVIARCEKNVWRFRYRLR